MSSLDYLDLCRLCLVKDRVSVPIFEGEGDVRQIFLKITACLPVKVDREDKLPKKICDDCVYKVELFYQFWNTTVNAEKQLLQWLGEVGLEDKPDYVTNVLNQNVMKSDQSGGNRLDGSMMQQVSGHQNNMGMGMMDNIGLGMPMMMPATNQQQMTSVPMDTSGSSVQNVQEIPGTSNQSTHEQITQSQTNTNNQQEEEEDSSEEEENSEDECDGEEGLPVKEESEEDPNNGRAIEPTTFVNVSLACDEAGPSGLQQQKIAEMPEMAMPQNTDGDPKSGEGSFDDHREDAKSSQNGILRHQDSDAVKMKTISWQDCPRKLKSRCYPKTRALRYKKQKYELRKIKSVVDIRDVLSENEEESSCVKCNFRCDERSTTIAHVAEKHDEDGTRDEKYKEKKREFVCLVCDFVCARKETLRSHFVRKHTQRYRYSCEYCGKEFKIKGDLTTHTRLNHRESPVICDVCGKTCKNSHSLYTHQKHAHYKAKFECPVCRRRLVTKENLDQHVLTQHERKEKAVCEECGKTFFENYYLRKHMRIHTGDKPYSCTVCNRSFATHSSLSQHLLLHTGERIYACNVCGKSFAQKAGLICHRKIHSGTLPPLPVIHIDRILKDFMKK